MFYGFEINCLEYILKRKRSLEDPELDGLDLYRHMF